jgi:hypothetical protein
VSLEYKIGSSLGGMATLASLGIDLPQPLPVHHAEQVALGDGTLRGVGWLQCEWRFDWILDLDLITLRTFCPEPALSATVWIKTLKANAQMEVYTGKMWWPAVEPPLQGDYYEDFVITFVDLEKVTGT